MHILT